MNVSVNNIVMRKARLGDVPEIQKLVNLYASRGQMLPRSLSELYENIRDFHLYFVDGELAGCCALHISWDDLAEIKSLAVKEKFMRRGIGSALLAKCIEEAAELGLRNIFVLTYCPEFFEKHQFQRIEKHQLPHKIWYECTKCHKFPDCDEVPLIRVLSEVNQGEKPGEEADS